MSTKVTINGKYAYETAEVITFCNHSDEEQYIIKQPTITSASPLHLDTTGFYVLWTINY